MEQYKISYTGNVPQEDKDSIEELFWDYLSSLYQNGQIYKNYELIKTANGYDVFVTAPDAESLNEKYNNQYADKGLSELSKWFHWETVLIGLNVNVNASCTCGTPSWYYLFSDCSDEGSPIVCGDCGDRVPLYKMPYFDKRDEYFQIVSWQDSYKCVDKLFMHCLSDRFTYRQLNDINSVLSKSGIEICKEFETLLKRPFYYYIYHYKKTKEQCPRCGRPWTRMPEDAPVDFMCEQCRFVADEV